MSGVHCHMCVSSTVGCVLVCTLLYSTVQSTVKQCLCPGCLEAGVKAAVMQYCIFKALYCKVKNVLFVFIYYLCEKYYKHITVQRYIADCVFWIPRLNLLDLQTNLIYKHPLRTELNRMQGAYCTTQATMMLLMDCCLN